MWLPPRRPPLPASLDRALLEEPEVLLGTPGTYTLLAVDPDAPSPHSPKHRHGSCRGQPATAAAVSPPEGRQAVGCKLASRFRQPGGGVQG